MLVGVFGAATYLLGDESATQTHRRSDSRAAAVSVRYLRYAGAPMVDEVSISDRRQIGSEFSDNEFDEAFRPVMSDTIGIALGAPL
ncbi:hypothetical protein H8A99_05075 [Bradyrhizobium sp. Arg68]|uniref:hypothetical protein n=1 Tax=Bradyrhizobium ivorense TaxID=2511166 RepID=UPI001E4EC703|nr:hypothetical protein [Bradyrhizobium ivorense]MCC8935880.1 hypothetical protein [Bradyrhizobium ivorense]